MHAIKLAVIPISPSAKRSKDLSRITAPLSFNHCSLLSLLRNATLAMSPPLAGRITFRASPHKVALSTSVKVGQESTTPRKTLNLMALMRGEKTTKIQASPKGVGFVLDKLS